MAVYSPGSNVEEALSTTTPSRAGLILPIISALGSMPGSSTNGRLGSDCDGRTTAPIHSAGRKRLSSTSRRGNLRAVQILLGHTKIESTVRYLGADIEDALALAEGTEV